MNEILKKYADENPRLFGGSADGPDKLQKYMELVLEYNKSINLTAIKDEDEFVIKNIVDSLAAVGSDQYRRSHRVIDIGTGAGLPGIPLAVLSPDKEFVLMDSLAKRVNIVDEMARALGLANVTAVHARAEDLARDGQHREKYDLCVSRAVSRLSVLSEYCLPFVKKGGYMLSYKGKNYADELEDAAAALRKLGGRVELTDAEAMKKYGLSHALVYILKYKTTPDKYPRRAGIPSKKPL